MLQRGSSLGKTKELANITESSRELTKNIPSLQCLSQTLDHTRLLCNQNRKSTVLVDCVYRVALNFCGSLILRLGDFLGFAGTNFCDWERLVFLTGN